MCFVFVTGDVEDCVIQPIPQGQFTPLPEALCWVILDLTSSGQAAVLDNIRDALHVAFPDMQTPTKEMVYDTLAKLMSDRKVTSHLISDLFYVFNSINCKNVQLHVCFFLSIQVNTLI